MAYIYIIIDDYTPDAGSSIYGVFSTEKKAQLKFNSLSSDDNEYGENLNKNDTLEIKPLEVDKIIDNTVFMLIDDYTPDAGSSIYGVFSTDELAQRRLKDLSSDDNEYGRDLNKNDTIDIRSERVY